MKTKFVPFTQEGFSAETPFQVRFKDDKGVVTNTVLAIFNQFGQILYAQGRGLMDPAPQEMEVPDETPSPQAPKP